MVQFELMLTGLIIGGIGVLIISYGDKRIEVLSKNDITKKIIDWLPKRMLGVFYWRPATMRLLIFVMNSKHWPKDKSVRKQLQEIRLVYLLGIILFIGGFLLAIFSMLNGSGLTHR